MAPIAGCTACVHVCRSLFFFHKNDKIPICGIPSSHTWCVQEYCDFFVGFAVIMLKFRLFGNGFPNIFNHGFVNDTMFPWERLLCTRYIDKADSVVPWVGESCGLSGQFHKGGGEMKIPTPIPKNTSIKKEMTGILIKQFDISKITRRTIGCQKRNSVRGIISTIHIHSGVSLILKGLVIHFHDQNIAVGPWNVYFYSGWFGSVRFNGHFFTAECENGKEEYSCHFPDTFKQKMFHWLRGIWAQRYDKFVKLRIEN